MSSRRIVHVYISVRVEREGVFGQPEMQEDRAYQARLQRVADALAHAAELALAEVPR